MSSSLLLGNFTTLQEQHQSTQFLSTNPLMSPTLAFRFYDKDVDTFCDTSTKPYGAAETNRSTTITNPSKLKKCTCCPYGYHIDLDFIRYCEELAKNGKQPTNKQLERRNKRRQRKSLEVMLGFNDQWLIDLGKQHTTVTKPQESPFQTVYEAFEELEKKVNASPYDNIDANERLIDQKFKQHLITSGAVTSTPVKNRTEQDEFVNNILYDVCTDFERTLERASMRTKKHCPENGSCISANDAYGHEKQLDLETAYYATKPNEIPNSCDQIKTTSAHEHIHQQDVLVETKAEQIATKHRGADRVLRDSNENTNVAASRKVADAANVDKLEEVNSINRNLNEQLRTARYQLTDNLSRIREFEERVRVIPKLELQLSVEKAENRDLHLKLKNLEDIVEQNEKQLKDVAVQSKDCSSAETSPFGENLKAKPFSTQRVCAMSLESLNIRFPNSSSTPSIDSPQRSTEQIKTSPSTSDAGSMTNRIISRDIGVVTVPPQIQSHSIGINTVISERNPFEVPIAKVCQLDIGVQCEIQPKLRMRNVGTTTERERSPPPKPISHSIGITAVPSTRTASCAAKPETRSIGVDNIHRNARVRSIGTDPIKCLVETIPSEMTAPAVSSISLKLLDSLAAQAQQKPEPLPEKPKEAKSIGIQYSPNVSSKFSQCKSFVTPPKVQTHTEATDTNDLTLLIHRGCNTDAVAIKKDCITNTDRIRTVDEATNTVSTPKHFTDMGTNPEPVTATTTKTTASSSNTVAQSTGDASASTKADNKCTSCLARIEIKQRTIIKNPHKMNVATVSNSSATHHSSMSETHTDELLASLQQSDSQSRIPRPTALISPRPDRKFFRQNTYTIPASPSPTSTSLPLTPSSPVAGVSHVHTSRPPPCPAEAYLSPFGTPIKTKSNHNKNTSSMVEYNKYDDLKEQQIVANLTDVETLTEQVPQLYDHHEISCDAMAAAAIASSPTTKTTTTTSIEQTRSTTHEKHTTTIRTTEEPATTSSANNEAAEATSSISTIGETSRFANTGRQHTTDSNDDDEPRLWNHRMKSSSTYSSLAAKPRNKVTPSKEMQAALKVINDSLSKNQHLATTLKNANKIVQKEWFRISSTENASPFDVEDYLDCFEEYSPNLLKYIVNLNDANGNTAMHYAVSHGNFDVVSILLDSKVCNINSTNNAGYTCVMLVSLATLDVAEHQTVVQRLFQLADINVRAKKHSQTALMLATSHGNYDMVRMLLDAGADINIQDEDGSTALMCAAEHGRMDIIKILLAQPDCDSTIQDLDGSTALKISLEAGYRDIGVLLYAHEYMIKNKSPYTSLRGGRSRKHSASLTSSQNALPTVSPSSSIHVSSMNLDEKLPTTANPNK